MMNKESKIYIAGHNGMVGSAILRLLKREGYANLIVRTSRELDLICQQSVVDFFEKEKPEYVFLAAARVGGIKANFEYMADFTYQNLMIQNNLIHQSYIHGVKKLLFLGSTCIYPKKSPQPIKEEYLLSGYLESTNEGYALAKILGIKMCGYYRKQFGCDFIALMPTNLYGKGDHYNTENSHVISALITKIYDATQKGEDKVIIWGTGTPKREFLYVDDLADACLFTMQNHSGDEFLNVGTGKDISIMEVAKLISEIIGFKGEVVTDTSMPDGTPLKCSDVSRINTLGWKAKIGLKEGLEKTIALYQGIVKAKKDFADEQKERTHH